MHDRTPFGWLRERDIDLLLCAELHHDGALRRLFERRLGCDGAKFSGAWVSVAELEGESDLVIAWKRDDSTVLALVENKIAAGFQPDQGLRYRKRADRWGREPGIGECTTVLIAPEQYMDWPGSTEFRHHLSYEDLASRLRKEGDPRSEFLADALEAGTGLYRRGYVAVPDAAVSSVWQAVWERARDLTPSLRMSRPATKPSRSNWIYFRQAIGLQDQTGIVLVWKAERGQVDLQFSETGTAELEGGAGKLGEPDMTVEPAGKSASIRLLVPAIDFARPPQEQLADIDAGLLTCERLRQFYSSLPDTVLQRE